VSRSSSVKRRYGSDLNSRSFGKTLDLVTTFGGAWLTGLQANGVVGCATSFPGLPGAVEVAPYRALIESGQLQMIMSATEVIPALDPRATFR
jgi:beta-glucosidase-like glycosyl hydrolase